MNAAGAAGAAAAAHPNLALVKYWGKADAVRNLPATPSLGISLDALRSRVEVRLDAGDSIALDGRPVAPARYRPFLDAVRRRCGTRSGFRIRARNDFPSAAGLASSSSGFAALASACTAACGARLGDAELSALARVGSASAARAVFGGFAVLPARAEHAQPLAPAAAWPELRVVIAVVTAAAKPVGSREAMERVRRTSPAYEGWVRDSPRLYREAVAAVRDRDLTRLGGAMRKSYCRMFATMLAADPPIRYWLPETLALLAAVEELRARGVAAWETMDAGPQVKVLCADGDAGRVAAALAAACPGAPPPVVSAIGAGVRLGG